MIYITNYNSPVGNILLAAKKEKLIGLWIDGQKHCLQNYKDQIKRLDDYKIFIKTKKWLDRYFNKEIIDINELSLELNGTDFRKQVWKILMSIPYGSVITYNDIAKKIAKENGIKKMSAQAVGGAVGHNPISIIIPCHRVVGENNNLVGYTGGIKIKMQLLSIEGIDISKYKLPKKGLQYDK